MIDFMDYSIGFKGIGAAQCRPMEKVLGPPARGIFPHRARRGADLALFSRAARSTRFAA
jgi:hypothetical protein